MESSCDLLFEIPPKKRKQRSKLRDLYALVLIEQQSTPDADLAIRVMYYTFAALNSFRKEHPKEVGYPTIFPFVLYTGKNPYSYSLKVIDAFRSNYRIAKKVFGNLSIQMTQLCKYQKGAYQKAGRLTHAGVFQYMLKVGAYRKLKDYKRLLEAMGPEMKSYIKLEGRKGFEYLREGISYLESCASITSKEGNQELVSSLPKEAQERYMSYTEKREKAVWDKGLKEGRQEGEHQGKLETAKNMLSMGQDIDFVAKATGLPKKEIEELTRSSAA